MLEIFQCVRSDPAWWGASVQLRIGSEDGRERLDISIQSPQKKRRRHQVAGA